MARTFLRQETQIRNSDLYDDTITPSEAAFETNPTNIETDLNNMRSQLSNLLDAQAGNWWDDLNTPSALEAGSQRGVNDLNTALHAVEKKRVLRDVFNLTDVTVGGSDNWVVLGAGELPAQTTAAVGAVTSLGTVVATHGGTFASHDLAEVAGPHALNPKNLCIIVDGATRDPILSGGRQVYGLLQGESGLADGDTILSTTPDRVQISFVRQNAAGDDLEACPAADIQGKTINYASRERVRLEDLTEADFLAGAVIDVGAGSATVNRQVAYDNQGTTPVDLTNNATLDLEGAGLAWSIRDDLEANLFSVTEGSAGSSSVVAVHGDVDTFDVDAVANDFANGLTANSGGSRPIAVGETDGEIGSTAGDLMVRATAELLLDDGNQTGSTWAQDGIKLSEDTAEWDDFETAFGEVSLLNAIKQAKDAVGTYTKTHANVTSDTAADTDVGGVGGGANLDAQIHDLSNGNFVADHDFFINGQLLRNGADASANHDVYPGTSLPNGQLKFEFKVVTGDVLCALSRA